MILAKKSKPIIGFKIWFFLKLTLLVPQISPDSTPFASI